MKQGCGSTMSGTRRLTSHICDFTYMCLRQRVLQNPVRLSVAHSTVYTLPVVGPLFGLPARVPPPPTVYVGCTSIVVCLCCARPCLTVSIPTDRIIAMFVCCTKRLSSPPLRVLPRPPRPSPPRQPLPLPALGIRPLCKTMALPQRKSQLWDKSDTKKGSS